MSERDEVIAGRYRLVELVGRGAAGVVWRARDERLGRSVAVKLLTATDSPSAVERIVREGRVAARLRHPHAVTVHDVIEHGGKPCLVMEYLPSKTLAELVDERGPLPEALVAGVGWQVASALAAAHADGIVHRDVTTFNILLAEDGTAKIADFGIARAIGENTVTDARIVVGTPAFLAPEVAAGQDAVFASDVYSLGATLYAALEGHPPFGTTDNPYALLRRVADGDVEPMRFSGPLGDVLELVLRRDPAERPTMAELHALLGAVVEGRPLPGTPPPPQNGDTRPLPAHRRVPWRRMALIAGAVVLVATGIVIGNSLARQDPAGTAEPAPTPTTTSAADPSPSSAETPSSTTDTTAGTTAGTTATTTTTRATTTTNPAAAPPPGCTARFAITNSWPGGYQAHVTVRNTSAGPLGGWTVTWPRPEGHSISNLWNGTVDMGDDSVTVRNLSHNGKLPVDDSTTFGFTANGPGVPAPDLTCASS
ncbi:serine/threonine protein kinase [Saccharothrix saharensis]|uniref:non-specific serine/threonine protein kinase n=1 Tax=Saccharothrix saharensis TaxID=571190 RepID=A0A543JRR5_9PSEU|nr:protein kinase [Saccharothrix saharensis]TQM85543.1 serine/threonine protein kinase [Saccharothrix saharensis]